MLDERAAGVVMACRKRKVSDEHDERREWQRTLNTPYQRTEVVVRLELANISR